MFSILVDDDNWELDEEFFLKLTLSENKEDENVAKIGKKHIMTIRFSVCPILLIGCQSGVGIKYLLN